ncbi:MAG TPA: hypothetical protein VEK12_08660 [Alphaproteobacteria bacterium]|nr:hypothetical protein [Alphaproteobacteria bacterium]
MRRNYILALISALACLALCGLGPAQAQCTLPYSLTNGQTADASQVMANYNALLNCLNNAPAGSTDALQYNAGSGSFGGVGPLTNGQLAIGSTGAAPQAATLTAGQGIAITNGPGSITISGAASPYTPPKLANFTAGNAPSGTTAADSSTGLAMTYPSSISAWNAEVYWDNTAYSGNETVTVGVNSTLLGLSGFYGEVGIAIGDSSSKLVIITLASSNGPAWTITYLNSYSSYNTDTGGGIVAVPVFLRFLDDGTNFNMFAGNDLNSLVKVASVARGAFIGAPTRIGLIVQGNNAPVGATFFHYARSP